MTCNAKDELVVFIIDFCANELEAAEGGHVASGLDHGQAAFFNLDEVLCDECCGTTVPATLTLMHRAQDGDCFSTDCRVAAAGCEQE